MLDNLYKNIGGKIKSWAKLIFIIEAIGAIITGLVLIFTEEDLFLYGLLTFVCGPIVAYVGSWLLYAFGELVEDVHAIRNKEGTTEEKAKREASEKAKREAEEKAKREAEKKAKQEAEDRVAHNEKYLIDDEFSYDQHICSSEDELKQYIEKVLDEQSRPKELLDLYWQYKKYIYGYYPNNETKSALEKVIEKCQSNAYEGNSQMMITICKTKLSKL